MAFNHLPSSDS